MERNSRTRLTTAVIIALVFGSGALVGMAWDRTQPPSGEEAAPARVADDAEDASGDEGRERRGRMIDRIDLSDKQRTAIDAIIAGHRARMDSLNVEFRGEYYPRFYGIVDETRARLMGELNEEQAAAYRELLDEWDSEHPRYEDEELPFRRRD